jgi:hypothetical protein
LPGRQQAEVTLPLVEVQTTYLPSFPAVVQGSPFLGVLLSPVASEDETRRLSSIDANARPIIFFMGFEFTTSTATSSGG